MSKPPRDTFSISSNTYFITTTAAQGKPLFQSTRVAELFLATLFSYRDQNKFKIYEFVLMPNHLHILLTPANEITLERAIQFIKGGFSYRAGKELDISQEIWQRGYVDHRIRSIQEYETHREYIYQNPVKDRFSESPDKFPYCSAFPGFKLDAVPQWLKPAVVTVSRHG